MQSVNIFTNPITVRPGIRIHVLLHAAERREPLNRSCLPHLLANGNASWFYIRQEYNISNRSAVYDAQRLRPQHVPICHPQKIPSKYIVSLRGRNSKEHNYPRSREQVADRIISLRPSDYSSLKEYGYYQVQLRSHGIHRHHRQPPNHSRQSQIDSPAMRSLAAPIPDVNLQPTGAWERPRAGFLSYPVQKRVRVPNNSTKFGIY